MGVRPYRHHRGSVYLGSKIGGAFLPLPCACCTALEVVVPISRVTGEDGNQTREVWSTLCG